MVVSLAAVQTRAGQRHLQVVGLGVEPPLPPPGPVTALPAMHARLVRACVLLAEERLWSLLAGFVSLARMAQCARYGAVPSLPMP